MSPNRYFGKSDQTVITNLQHRPFSAVFEEFCYSMWLLACVKQAITNDEQQQAHKLNHPLLHFPV